MTELDGAAPSRSARIGRRTPPAATVYDLICTHDLDGYILSANPAACDVLGLSADLLRGMRIQDLLPPDGVSGFAEYMQKLTDDGFAAGMMRVVTLFSGEHIWEYRNTLVLDEESAPIVHGVAADVTEREGAFHEVRRSEEHFRSIIENASDIIAIVGLDGRIRYGSPSVERVLGYPRKVLAGMPGLDLIHPDDAGRAADFLARQVADPAAIQTIELRARHHGGSWRSFEVVATNLVKGRKTSAVVINARDITERKLLEAQLVQANRLGGLGRLAATVAHEFNNVLMGIQPFAELMQRPDATPQIISKGAWHIANSIQRGRRIVLDILRFSQPHEPVTTAVDLGEWWANFAPEAEAVLGNMVSVVSTIPPGLFAIADRTQLSQVLSNLVANARDAMPDGGTLTVEGNDLDANRKFPFGVVPNPDRFVQLSVSDTGCGMPAEVMERAFEPLYTTRQSGGTGLGLAVAHQVLTQHGGYLFVESEPGRGSTFHLFLPKAVPPSSNGDLATGPDRRPVARKVLIIDDEEAIVDGITTLLGQEGIEVESIGSGVEAAKAIARFDPDVVLLDFGLPDMDGSEVYACIRALNGSLPVIFATGHGDRRILHDNLNDPRTRFLQKPFEVADLLGVMLDLESGGSE
ncbi:MAG TPA: PAS domain S-box protein [Thermoanaerobaculia bacterium]|nr:PAS domain S-box protein [Thermoanaerobaculia bacterium]